MKPNRALTFKTYGPGLTSALAAAEDHTIMAQFRQFWAVSAAVGQFDAYPYHFDDFFVYDDPTTGRLHFIPWGNDDTITPVGAINALLNARAAMRSFIAERHQTLINELTPEPCAGSDRTLSYHGRSLPVAGVMWAGSC